MVELAKEEKVFASGQARIKAVIRAGVVPEAAADIARAADDVMSGDRRAAASREQECGNNAKQGGLAGAIGTQKRDCFALVHFESNIGKSRNGGFFEWLEKRAPAAAGGRKRLAERFDGYGGASHHATYNVSRVFKTNAGGDLSEGP